MWDTEIWMLPNVLLMNPNWSEQILHYRFQRLREAIAYANVTGLSGARSVLDVLMMYMMLYE